MKPILIEPVQADYDVIATWLTNAAACRRWAGPHLPFPFTAAQLPELLGVSGARSYCLSAGGVAPLGFGQYWPTSPGTAHLGRIIITPDARGQGLGKLLCEQLIAQAVHTTGADRVTLRVYRDNSAARSLYARLGFSEVDAESSAELLFMRAHPERNPIDV